MKRSKKMDKMIKGLMLFFASVLGIFSLPVIFILTVILVAVEEAHKQIDRKN